MILLWGKQIFGEQGISTPFIYLLTLIPIHPLLPPQCSYSLIFHPPLSSLPIPYLLPPCHYSIFFLTLLPPCHYSYTFAIFFCSLLPPCPYSISIFFFPLHSPCLFRVEEPSRNCYGGNNILLLPSVRPSPKKFETCSNYLLDN